MYPLFIEVNDENLIVCSQDFFLVIKINVNDNTDTVETNQ